MQWQFVGISILLFISSSSTWAEAVPFPRIFSDVPIQRFSPTDNPRFDLIERELKNVIARRGDPLIANVFCASGFVFPDGEPLTTVIWANKSQLYWWDGSAGQSARQESITLLLSPYSDLIRVAEDGDILSGPTTVNRSQAKSAIEDCEQYGQKFLVRPFTPAKDKRDEDLDIEELDN